MKLLSLALSALLLCVSSFANADSRGEQKQTFGEYEVHYIGLTSNFLSPTVAKAYGIDRSRQMGFLNISVLHTQKGQDLGTPITAKVSGTIRNLVGQARELEFKEIIETDSVYYISTFRFDDEDRYHMNLKVTPEGQNRTFDVKFDQKFYFE